MLTIRQTQFGLFSRLEEEKFEEWMLLHLPQFFPDRCAALGQRHLREFIQHGIRQAAAYDVTIRRDVCKYIDVMMVLGRDFDSDPHLPWAAEILTQRRNPAAKIRALVDAARRHVRGA